ncbi:MAG: hypothetical protein ACI32N_02025 [Bulleidia sp.]
MRRVSENPNDPHRYDDMLDLPNHRSGLRKPLSDAQRAAQFLPFSALSGYGESIHEADRSVVQRRDLSPCQKDELDETIRYVMAHPGLEVTVTWFEDDPFKQGGQYHTKTGIIRRIEPVTGKIIFTDHTHLWLTSVDDIEYR